MAHGADVVVVAAGSSQRFGGDKLEADVGGRPLLAWTIDRLAASERVERIVVVTSAERVDRIRDAPWLSPRVVAVVAGGARRQESVAAGIVAVSELAAGDAEPARANDGDDSDDGAAGRREDAAARRDAVAALGADHAGRREDAVARRDAARARAGGERVVLVHDGARPLVSVALVEAVIDAVRMHGAAVPMVAIPDTVRRIGPDGQIVETLDRTGLAVAQTPQGARLALFRQALPALAAADAPEFTDEAALLAACRIEVHAIPGDELNLKVTLPGDLARVEMALTGLPASGGDSRARSAGPAARVGIGSDSHPFGPGDGLALGGIVVPEAPRLHGHSDGDVVLHAVADALLGAAGLGDLGRLFPAGPATPRGIASSELLADVVGRVTAAGFTVASLDCTIVAARPRLAELLPAIGQRVAGLVAVEPDAVNVKASTGNLDGMEGAGRGISATAIAVLTNRPADR